MSQPVLLRQSERNLLRTIVVGAGEAGLALARDLHRVSSFGLDPVGFLDDDTTKQGRRFGGRRVFGTLADLELVLERNRVDVVVVAIPSMPPHEVKRLGLRAAAQGVTVLHLPPFLAALQRQIAGTDMRALQVGPLAGRRCTSSAAVRPRRSPANGCWSPARVGPSGASCADRCPASALPS
jgi:FlaA1/EpsC-like NDP-sugar epimerase